jgi:inosine-uridine nucleoside N-ribohydrolase
MTEKILLDTDIGSDIDDAVCLAYLLAQPDCELLGVTTVTGESQRRAQMVSALCTVAGKVIPVVPGIERPLIIQQRQPTAPQAVKLKDWPHQSRFSNIPAIQFLAENILAHPGEVTLLAVGPLTNVALLFSVFPETTPSLKQLVLMCGVFTDDPNNTWKAEWNAILDPHATQMVYQTEIPIHKSVGLDVTQKVRLPAEEVKEAFTHPILEPVLDFASVWFEAQEWMIFHDPLAAVSIFDSEVCTFSKGLVKVNSDLSAENPGSTIFEPMSDQGPHQVALKVDPDRFFESFFRVFD